MRQRILLLLLPLLAFASIGARRRAVDPPAPPTFNRDVARILQQRCQSCHRPGDIAPFSLLTYRDAAARAFEIKAMTTSRRMPPWKPAAGCGDFVQSRVMSDDEIRTIAQWVDAGAPQGKPEDLPPAIDLGSDWALGTPDLVLRMPKSFTPPSDRDEYRCFSLPVPSTTDLAASTIDFRPGDRATVHHIIPFIDRAGASAKLDKNGDGYSCFGGPGIDDLDLLGGWSPGARPTPLPSGTAVIVPGKSRIIMQVHYHPHFAQVAPDLTEIGIYLAKGEVKKALHYDVIWNRNFVIPAGAHDYRVDAELSPASDIHIVSIYPHMHLLGQKISVDAVMPDGAHQCLVDIPNYEFTWQGQYIYRNPIAIPKGAQLHLEAHFDNSDDNVMNPNSPPKTVRFGEASTDEMAVALVGYTIDNP